MAAGHRGPRARDVEHFARPAAQAQDAVAPLGLRNGDGNPDAALAQPEQQNDLAPDDAQAKPADKQKDKLKKKPAKAAADQSLPPLEIYPKAQRIGLKADRRRSIPQ